MPGLCTLRISVKWSQNQYGAVQVADAGSVGLPGGQVAQLAQAQQALAAEPTGVEADLSLWRQHLGIATAEGALQQLATSYVTHLCVHLYAHICNGN